MTKPKSVQLEVEIPEVTLAGIEALAAHLGITPEVATANLIEIGRRLESSVKAAVDAGATIETRYPMKK